MATVKSRPLVSLWDAMHGTLSKRRSFWTDALGTEYAACRKYLQMSGYVEECPCDHPEDVGGCIMKVVSGKKKGTTVYDAVCSRLLEGVPEDEKWLLCPSRELPADDVEVDEFQMHMFGSLIMDRFRSTFPVDAIDDYREITVNSYRFGLLQPKNVKQTPSMVYFSSTRDRWELKTHLAEFLNDTDGEIVWLVIGDKLPGRTTCEVLMKGRGKSAVIPIDQIVVIEANKLVVRFPKTATFKKTAITKRGLKNYPALQTAHDERDRLKKAKYDNIRELAVSHPKPHYLSRTQWFRNLASKYPDQCVKDPDYDGAIKKPSIDVVRRALGYGKKTSSSA